MEPTGPPRGEADDAATSEDDLDEAPLDADEIRLLRVAARMPRQEKSASP
jgi:hypothetical protein